MWVDWDQIVYTFNNQVVILNLDEAESRRSTDLDKDFEQSAKRCGFIFEAGGKFFVKVLQV